MSITILYDFKFRGGALTEIKFNTLDNTNKKDRFQWYVTLNNKRYELNFIEMVGNTRFLYHKDIGTIEFDPTTGQLESLSDSQTLVPYK